MRCLCSRVWVIRDQCQTPSGRQLPSLGSPKPCGNIHSNPQKPVEAATPGPVREETPWQDLSGAGDHGGQLREPLRDSRPLAPRQKLGETSRGGIRTECPADCGGQAPNSLCDPRRSQNLFSPTTFVVACLWPTVLQPSGLTMTKTPYALKG